jgi:hypothetical protein
MCLFINDNKRGACMMGRQQQHLNSTFDEQRIGWRGPVNWPSRSSDLNSLDSWLWGHLTALVYSVPIIDLEILQQRVENTSKKFSIERAPLCNEELKVVLKMHGNHIDHLLWRSKEHRPYLSRHYFLDIC